MKDASKTHFEMLAHPSKIFVEHEVFTSNVCNPKSCTHTLEKDFENAFEMLVRPSKIVVWGGGVKLNN